MAHSSSAASCVGEGSTGDPAEVRYHRRPAAGSISVMQGDPVGVADIFAAEGDVTSFDFMQPGITTVTDICRNVENIARQAVGPAVMHYRAVTVHVVASDFAWSRPMASSP